MPPLHEGSASQPSRRSMYCAARIQAARRLIQTCGEVAAASTRRVCACMKNLYARGQHDTRTIGVTMVPPPSMSCSSALAQPPLSPRTKTRAWNVRPATRGRPRYFPPSSTIASCLASKLLTTLASHPASIAARPPGPPRLGDPFTSLRSNTMAGSLMRTSLFISALSDANSQAPWYLRDWCSSCPAAAAPIALAVEPTCDCATG